MLNRLIQSGRQTTKAFAQAWRTREPVKVTIAPKLKDHTQVDISRLPEVTNENAAPRYEAAASYRGKLIRQIADPNAFARRGKQSRNGVELRPQYRLAEVLVQEEDLATEFGRQPYPRYQVCLIFVYKPTGPDAKSLFGFNQMFSFHEKS